MPATSLPSSTIAPQRRCASASLRLPASAIRVESGLESRKRRARMPSLLTSSSTSTASRAAATRPPTTSLRATRSQRESSRSGRARSTSAAAASETEDDRETLKASLLRLVARVEEKGNTRTKVTDAERREVNAAVEALEARNPTPEPALAPELLSGEWALLYVGPGTIPESAATAEGRERDAGIEWKKRSGGLEGPILSFLSPLSLKGKLVKRTGVTQVIDVAAGRISNVASFALFGTRPGFLDVRGTVERTPGSKTRVDVAFDVAEVSVPSLRVGIKLPLSWASPRGWVETTYVDDDVRIGRGDKGSVFVTARRKGK